MVATPRLSIEEFAAMPIEGQWELVDGEPVEVTPAEGHSSRIGGCIYALLLNQFELPGLGWAYPADAGFILFSDRAAVRPPDAAHVSRARLSEEPRGFVPVAPDFAAEVLFPTDRHPDALAKVAMYLQAGVRLVWLVDPARRTVTVFHLDDTITTHSDGDTLERGDVLPGFIVTVSAIFGGAGEH